MPRKNLIIFLALLFATALGVSRAISDDKYYREMQTFSAILHQVMENYVEEVEPEEMFEGAYNGMLGRLDPYTQYLNVSQTKMFAEDTEGAYGGLGSEISIKDGMLTVISPILGTPAYEAGVQAGDVILEIDGQSTERISIGEAVDILRGKVGSEVTLTVRHPDTLEEEEITIERQIIKPPSLTYAIVDEEHGIGLMRIPQFTAPLMEEMREAFEDMKANGAKSLIVDLRQNPGGLLNVAVEMCDEFVAEGTIVSVKGRNETLRELYRAEPGDMMENVPLVILIDGGSASASEIVAGCVRDLDRGILVGSRTYGKGSVQNVIPLGEGEALKLTVARYYTPDDKPIAPRQGIVPDVIVPMTREHLIALRNQEREDKLRGQYHLGSNLIEENGADAPEDAAPEGGEIEEPDGPEEELKHAAVRRGRVIDIQLKAAVNMLRWHPGTAAR